MTRIKAISNKKKNGIYAFPISTKGTLKRLEAAYRLIPTGGVKYPIYMLIKKIIPK